MRCFVYVDGSYMEGTNAAGEKMGVYGSGSYLQLEGYEQPIFRSIGGSDQGLARMRNVTGEIRAVIDILQILSEESPDSLELDIYYDYDGIEKWVTGEWKANKIETQSYRDFVRSKQKTMKIRFHSVKGHSGIAGNDIADRLAKQACKDEANRIGVKL